MGTRRRFAAITSVLLLSSGLLGIAAPSTALAREHEPQVLTSTSDTASWSGRFDAGAFGVWPAVTLPEACTPQLCDIVPLEVRLPESTWQHRPGGMLIAIQSPVVDLTGYDIDLFVYAPDGSLAASSAFGFGGEAAWIENPVNGRYTVKVVPKSVVSQPLVGDLFAPLTYDGFVRFDHGVTVRRAELRFGQEFLREFVAFGLTERRPAVELLPDLVPTRPRNFHIETTAGVPPFFYLNRGPGHQPSCYPEETLGLTDDDLTLGDVPLRCLRFDQGTYNLGDGPWQLNVYEDEPGVYQRIYSSDGEVRMGEPLGEVEFHDAHGHFHYLGFQEITLHHIEQDGSLTFVKEKPDKGICFADVEMMRFGRTDHPTSPRGYPGGTTAGLPGGDEAGGIRRGDMPWACADFQRQDPDDPKFPNRPFLEMGISVGWADVYSWAIADQYIDITDVSDGDYALIVDQDVRGRIREKHTHNNTAIGCVRITGDLADEIPCPRSR